MPQTLAALLALVLASLLMFNQQRLALRSHKTLVTSELELAAAGVASEVIAFIDGRSFDEESTPSAIGAEGDIPDAPSDFSGPGSFGTAGDCNLLQPALTPGCDDVDDVDSEDWRSVEIELAHGRRLPFEVRTRVFYVDHPESMEAAAGRTRHKRVLLDIRSPSVPHASEGLYRATRVISYDPIKAEMDWENSEYYDPAYGTATEETGGTTNETGGSGS